MTVYVSFLLTIIGLKGIYSITTVSKVSVKEGSSITIPCLYDSRHKKNVKYLCKGYYWSSCEYVVKTNQAKSGRFSIYDDNQRIFTVTLKDLTDEHFWCAVEINNGLDIKTYFQLSLTKGDPRLSVDHQDIVGFIGHNITIKCHHSDSGPVQWCRLGGSCVIRSGSIDKTKVTINTSVLSVSTVTMSELTTESSGWYLCVKGHLQMPVYLNVSEETTTTTSATVSPKPGETSAQTPEPTVDLKGLLIPLGLLIFIVMVALFIWFRLKRGKQSKVTSSSTMTAEEEVTYSEVKLKRKTSDQACQDKVYCNVGYMSGTSGQKMSATETDVDVICSSVVTMKQQTVKKDQEVTYSTLRQQHHQM